MKDIIAAKAKEQQIRKPKSVLTTLSEQNPINTRAEIAKRSGVSEGTIAKIETIQQWVTAKVLEIPLPAPETAAHALIAGPAPS